MRHKRHRGGQPGNQNARKHGFYSELLTPGQERALGAFGRDGLDREIALLRIKIQSLLANDPDNVGVLATGLSSLALLLRTKQLLGADGCRRRQLLHETGSSGNQSNDPCSI